MHERKVDTLIQLSDNATTDDQGRLFVGPEPLNQEETMASKTSKSSKSKKTAVSPTVAHIMEDTDIRPNVAAFVEWVVENGGPEIDEHHAQICIGAYKYYQKSDKAVETRLAASAAREEEREQRKAAAEAKRAAAKAKAAEEAEAKAAKAAKKTTSKKTSAAKDSAPKSAKAGKATAKKTASKSSKAKSKAAF